MTMIAGLLLLLCGNVASWAAIRQISHREATHAAERCADPRGNLAVRQQFAKVADLIRRTSLKPTAPDYIAPKEASKRFADSYSAAVRQMGAVPQCLGPND